MSNTIAEGLERIINAKAAIDTSITAKGGDVTIGLENTPSDIMTIQAGVDPEPINDAIEDANDELEAALGGGSSVVPKGKVNFYDYDGTLVKSMSSAQFSELESMPANPTHAGLTAQGWNWSLADAKTYVATHGSLNIGQQYTTSDGKTRLYIRLGDGRLKPYLGLTGNSSGTTVDINWGDGSATETVVLNSSTVYTPHEYSNEGEYVITVDVTTGAISLNGNTDSGADIFRKSTQLSWPADGVYRNILTKIELGNNITAIGQYAFSYCESLTSITIPNTVTSIGVNAFQYCYGLTSITIPNTVTSIGNYAFNGCYSLTSVTIPNTVTSIGSNAFNGCYSLTSVTIPNTVTSIGSNAFQNCNSLTSITLPNTVTSIGSNAFQNCNSLASVTIPNTLTSIGNGAFNGCYSLTSVTIPNTVTSIGSNAFQNCYSLASVTIPDGVTSIGTYAFNGCYSLTSITLSNTVTSIGSNAFNGCYSLTSVTIPNTVTSIGSNAFYNCQSLTSITLPNTLKGIGNNVFYGCYSLTSITIPNTVTSIGSNAFNGSYGLGFVRFNSAKPTTISSSNTWTGVPTDCIIFAPALVVNLYMDGTNYPSKASYTYIGFATYESGEALPTVTTDETYTLTWYATQTDAIAQTNPITQGNGNEVYAIATAI